MILKPSKMTTLAFNEGEIDWQTQLWPHFPNLSKVLQRLSPDVAEQSLHVAATTTRITKKLALFCWLKFQHLFICKH